MRKRRQVVPEPPGPVRRRKIVSGKPRDTEQAQLSLSKFLDHGKNTPKRQRRNTLKAIDALIKDAEIRSSTGNWDGCTGRTFVGLYAFCFRMIYDEVPIELYRSEGLIGVGAKNASAALRRDFKGDTAKMVEFLKWCWAREKGRDEWARRNHINRKPLGLRFQFSETLLQEYRINVGRRRVRK